MGVYLVGWWSDRGPLVCLHRFSPASGSGRVQGPKDAKLLVFTGIVSRTTGQMKGPGPPGPPGLLEQAGRHGTPLTTAQGDNDCDDSASRNTE